MLGWIPFSTVPNLAWRYTLWYPLCVYTQGSHRNERMLGLNSDLQATLRCKMVLYVDGTKFFVFQLYNFTVTFPFEILSDTI